MQWNTIASYLLHRFCCKEERVDKTTIRCLVCNMVIYDDEPKNVEHLAEVYKHFKVRHPDLIELAQREIHEGRKVESKSKTTSTQNKGKDKMVLISVHVPKQMLDELDRLVQEGKFPNRSEAIRVAIRDLILKEKAREKSGDMGIIIVPGR